MSYLGESLKKKKKKKKKGTINFENFESAIYMKLVSMPLIYG